MMKSYAATPIQRQQTKQKLTSTKDLLSQELARAVEKPQPIITRLLAGGISLLFFGTLTWAAVSKVDEVATAQAEVIPSSRVQPVRALSGGLLREIKVKNGDQIRKGDPLIALDPKLSEAEYQRLKQLVKMKEQTLTRLEAERSGQAQATTAIQDQLLASRLQEFNTRRDMAAAEARKQTGVIRAAQAELKGLKVSLSVANTKTASMAFLSEQGAVPRFDYLDTQNQVATLESQIAAKEQEIYQAQQSYTAAQKEIARLGADRQKEVLTEIDQHQQELASLTGQLAQAEEQRKRETLSAPIDGTVYNVKVVKSGATVQSGEELLSIVPKGEELILDAKVLNRDVGFVKPGMEVKVKLETFPYQEFGLVKGTVVSISPNAVTDEKLGLVYSSRIRLEQSSVQVKGNTVPLSPGMAATAEIVTRQKTVLSFLLEPVMKSWDSAFSIR
jgi:HlyD family secretion protein